MSGSGEQSITSAVAAGELEALRRGDRAQTERFVRRHAGWMWALARRMLRNDAQAEDAVQNAFANIFKSLNRFDERSALKTWMHRIAVNEALMITCEVFEDFIMAYLEDELPPKQKLVFELHLKVCREWREYLTAYRAAIELSKKGGQAEAADALDDVPEDLITAVVEARRS